MDAGGEDSPCKMHRKAFEKSFSFVTEKLHKTTHKNHIMGQRISSILSIVRNLQDVVNRLTDQSELGDSSSACRGRCNF